MKMLLCYEIISGIVQYKGTLYGVGNFSENGDVYDTALKVNINARP